LSNSRAAEAREAKRELCIRAPNVFPRHLCATRQAEPAVASPAATGTLLLMKHTQLFVLSLVVISALSGCAMNQSNTAPDPWSQTFSPPSRWETPRVRFVPLKPQHAQLDYDAFMSSRPHLRQTLQWGGWPSDDATVEDNRKDLERHWREHQANEAYTYAVLTLDGSRSLGCVYLKPIAEDEMPDLPRPAVRVAYWVVESELSNNLDRHVVRSLHDWLTGEWGFRSIVMPLHRANERGRAIAEAHGYTATAAPPDEKRRHYVWSNVAGTQ